VPRVTALRAQDRDRVAVDLDGHLWRVLPVDAVVRAGLVEGLELERARLRRLRRELRRSEGLAAAGRTLRRRDVSAHELDARLARADVPPAARADTLTLLERTGVVDDERFAVATAEALARRGWGDAAILFRLERAGVEPALARRAVHELEDETVRAAHAVAARGRSRKTAAFLSRRGFSEDAIEHAVGSLLADTYAEGYDV
jgi:regulatory protein